MAARIEEAVDAAVLAAHHEHRLAADMGGVEVACLGHHRVVGEKDPRPLEDALVFGLQHMRVVIGGAIDLEDTVGRPIVDIAGEITSSRHRALLQLERVELNAERRRELR